MRRLLIVLPLIFVGACGSKTQVAKNDTVKIGALLPYSGSLSNRGTVYENGIRAAIYMVNQAGGVDGHNLDLITQDTNSPPAPNSLTVDAATALLPKIDAKLILGPLTSGQFVGLSSWATTNKAVVLSATAGANVVDTVASNTYLWHSARQGKASYRAQALDIKALNKNKVVVIQSSSTGYADNANYLRNDFTALSYTATVNVVSYPSQADYTGFSTTAIVNEALSYSPDAIILNGDGAVDAGAILTDLKSNHSYSGQIYTGGSSGKAVTNAGPTYSAGVRTVFAIPPSAADLAAFNTVYSEWNSGNAPANTDPAQTFDATVWLTFAIAKAGSTDADKVAAAMPSIVDPNGVSVGPTEIKAGFEAIKAGKNLKWRGATQAFALDSTRAPIASVGVFACCSDSATKNPPYSDNPVATYAP